MKYIEITQDGAGLILSEKANEMGLYTKGVESCAIYTIWGSKGLLMIHDTAQIKIQDIFTLAKKVGKVSKIVFAVNERLQNQARKIHDEKRKKLINITKPKIVEKINLPLGILSVNHQGYETTTKMNEISSPPNNEKRFKIMFYNNLFSPTNSQSVDIDFQFDGNDFTDLPKLQRSIEKMREIARQKALEGDRDYINWLEADLAHLT